MHTSNHLPLAPSPATAASNPLPYPLPLPRPPSPPLAPLPLPLPPLFPPLPCHRPLPLLPPPPHSISRTQHVQFGNNFAPIITGLHSKLMQMKVSLGCVARGMGGSS